MKKKIHFLNKLVAVVAAAGLACCPAFAGDDFVILLDVSASMREKEPGKPNAGYLEPQQARKSREAVIAIGEVINHVIRLDDYFALLKFGDEPKLIAAQHLLHEHERVFLGQNLVSLDFADKKTDIVSGIAAAGELITKLGDSQRRKILILITDGRNDPPETSRYLTEDDRKAAYSSLRRSILDNRWNVKLVGLGSDTDISGVAQNLALPADRVLALDDQASGHIARKLQDAIQRERDAHVEMTAADTRVRLRLEPKLFGGFVEATHIFTITSYYPHAEEILFNTAQPVLIAGGPGLTAKGHPIQIVTQPSQPASFSLAVGYSGPRPEVGKIDSQFAFQFAEGSTRFYPNEGQLEIILPSWWETYSLYAMSAVIAAILLLFVVAKRWRESLVLDIRVAAMTSAKTLGSSFSLHKGEEFIFANGVVVGKTVLARGLDCKVAARVKYLGRRRFLLVKEEAEVVLDGKLAPRIEIGLDEAFDLRDQKGQALRYVTLAEGNQDELRGSHDIDPFSNVDRR